MNGSDRKMLENLIKRDGLICHYCYLTCNRINNHPKRASREHVVPTSLGGPNQLDNLVMACATCNERRGNIMHYCGCATCESIIDRLYYRPVFLAITNQKVGERAIIRSAMDGEVRVYRIKYKKQSFTCRSFEQAIFKANSLTKSRKKVAS